MPAKASHEVDTETAHTSLDNNYELKIRLERAISDNLDLRNEKLELEAEKLRLFEELDKNIKENETIVERNKDLKLSQAANKTTINRLNEIISEQKAEIEKFKSVNNYLENEEKNHLTSDNVNGFLNALNTKEKIVFLNNRIIELEQVNKTLYDLRDNWKRECNSINQDYLALEREYKRLLFSHKPRSETDQSITPTKALNKAPFELNKSALRERKQLPINNTLGIKSEVSPRNTNLWPQNKLHSNKNRSTPPLNSKRKENSHLGNNRTKLKNKIDSQAEYKTPTRITIYNFFKSQNN
ncbi:hypothetical protein BEWA_007580 [Theileria equi strain WA]|uniref:Uncharacterized protein n=1 Tax=Theileria equi strain WA TaxID=1537102 RepID=L0B2K9_THEEQ|nr:hypothetical protein BEWA_007580 [Theileria equi strain WA]AFZ81349.1 hypothetical protein BEWA_007580 [Theileria equi strain WA]|eukprot:XP_004831015.1 hypothetical protein BEWA_007580 [Theileria equi strain WA]